MMGDVLPFRRDLGGAKLLLWDFGEIGDLGAMARALSGESGVRHCISLPTMAKQIDNGV